MCARAPLSLPLSFPAPPRLSLSLSVSLSLSLASSSTRACKRRCCHPQFHRQLCPLCAHGLLLLLLLLSLAPLSRTRAAAWPARCCSVAAIEFSEEPRLRAEKLNDPLERFESLTHRRDRATEPHMKVAADCSLLTMTTPGPPGQVWSKRLSLVDDAATGHGTTRKPGSLPVGPDRADAGKPDLGGRETTLYTCDYLVLLLLATQDAGGEEGGGRSALREQPCEDDPAREHAPLLVVRERLEDRAVVP